MRCKGCDKLISARESQNVPGEFEDLCLTCRRASRIESDYESPTKTRDAETEDLLLLLFGRIRKRRQDE